MLSKTKLIPVTNTDTVGLGVGRRSLGRLIKDPPPGFPAVIRVNGLLFFEEGELEHYKRKIITGELPGREPARGTWAQAQSARRARMAHITAKIREDVIRTIIANKGQIPPEWVPSDKAEVKSKSD